MPPVKAVYHLKVPAVALDVESVTVPVAHRAAGIPVGADANGLIVATTAFRGVLSQVPLLKVT